MKVLPFFYKILKILINDLSDLEMFFIAHIVAEGLPDVEVFGVEPILTFFFGLSAVDMRRFASFVRIEKKSPALKKVDRRHDIEKDGIGGSKFSCDRIAGRLISFREGFMQKAAVLLVPELRNHGFG